MTPSTSAGIGPGQRAVVVGAGKSGQSAARLLARLGSQVVLCDEKPIAVALDGVQVIAPTVSLPLEGADLVVVSPGVPLAHPQLVAFRAANPSVRLIAEVELAYRVGQPTGRWTKLAAVTGTNGKSTTTALCGEILKAAGLRTFVGGNLGTPLCDALAEDFEAHVVELSSFQLEGIDTFRAPSAAILNVTPDHLDRYPSLTDYADAKARIFENQQPTDTAVLNGDDAWFAHLKGKVHAQLKTFGAASNDARPVQNGFAIRRDRAETSYRVSNRALRGDHNLANAMAAALLAGGLGIGPEAIQRGLDRFPGLPHRLELVREHAGVEWINDSKATNVESTTVALKAIPGPLLWIAGGLGKGAPYEPLAPLLGARLKRALLIGQDAPRIETELKPLGIRTEQVQTLEGAVARAAALADAGDTVLLSPACASYDQFRNYEERGSRFRALVGAL